jgi:glycosyltransferase involved in cell wall biosynthesis
MFLSEHVYDADYEHYRGRMPERVDTMTRMLCDASGLPADRLRKHIHFRQGFSFARVVEAFRPSYLHSYFFYEGTLFTFMASHLLGIPRGVSCYADHTLSDYDLKVVPLHLRDCDLIVATSHRIKRELVGLAPSMNPDRVVVKPNAINTNQFPLTSHLEPPPGEPHRLVCVSRYDPKKGLIFLVRALALLRQRGCNVEVHHVGGVDHDQKSSTEYARHLECEIRDLQLDDYVHLEGHRPESEVNAMLGRAHLFVAPFIEMPSGDKDGIPTTLLEAMSAGLPVVATDAGSITEVIDADRDGIIVRQRDPTALADAIAALLGDAPRRAQLARCAAEKVRAQFDVTVCEHVFHDALEALLSGRVVSFQA